MEIKINLRDLIELGIKIEDYFLLQATYYKLVNSDLITKNVEIINRLVSKGFITITNATALEFKLNNSAIELFEENPSKQFWEEFKNIYPKKTSSGRRLHDNPAKCREKYLRLAKTKENHNLIILGLLNESKKRDYAVANKQFFPEWKNMSTWLNQKSWEIYLEEDDENDGNSEFGKDI
jgi:hypothetical protein